MTTGERDRKNEPADRTKKGDTDGEMESPSHEWRPRIDQAPVSRQRLCTEPMCLYQIGGENVMAKRQQQRQEAEAIDLRNILASRGDAAEALLEEGSQRSHGASRFLCGIRPSVASVPPWLPSLRGFRQGYRILAKCARNPHDLLRHSVDPSADR